MVFLQPFLESGENNHSDAKARLFLIITLLIKKILQYYNILIIIFDSENLFINLNVKAYLPIICESLVTYLLEQAYRLYH